MLSVVPYQMSLSPSHREYTSFWNKESRKKGVLLTRRCLAGSLNDPARLRMPEARKSWGSPANLVQAELCPPSVVPVPVRFLLDVERDKLSLHHFRGRAEGLTDFARKGGNRHGRMELDALVPGKAAPSQVYFSSSKRIVVEERRRKVSTDLPQLDWQGRMRRYDQQQSTH